MIVTTPPTASSQRPQARNLATIITSLDAILGSEVLAQLNGLAFVKQGNRSLDERGKRLQVDISNIRSDGRFVPVNRPPLEKCYMLLNISREEVVMVGTYAQYQHLIGQTRGGEAVWRRLPHMYISSDYALTERFCQGIIIKL